MPHQHRLHRLRHYLQEKGCPALLVSYPIDLFYLTGQKLSDGLLLISETEALLIVDGRYEESCKKNCPFDVVLNDKFQLRSWLLDHSITSLGFDTEKTSYQKFLTFQTDLRGSAILLPLSDPVKTIRAIKDSQEIQLLKEAAQLGSEGFDFIVANLKEGIREKDLALELELFWRKKGGEGLAFDPIIAFGANGSMPHYRSGEARLRTGQGVLIDIGVRYQSYHSDMTRVLKIGSKQLREIYQIVKEAQSAALALCREGAIIGDLDRAARQIIAQNGYGDCFTHSLGHGIGLEVHELPFLRNKAPYCDLTLQAGMVITIEPGIYLPGIGGVRLENTILISKEGYEDLTDRDR